MLSVKGLNMKKLLLIPLLGCIAFAQSSVHYVPMSPGGVTQTGKWIVSNSGANLLITNPDGTTSTVAKTAGITQSVTVFALPANGVILSCTAKTGTAFTGTTTLTATVGITGSLTGCISTPYDMKAAVSNTNLSIALPTTPIASVAGTNVVLALTATVDNLTSISAGSITIWLTWFVLP